MNLVYPISSINADIILNLPDNSDRYPGILPYVNSPRWHTWRNEGGIDAVEIIQRFYEETLAIEDFERGIWHRSRYSSAPFTKWEKIFKVEKEKSSPYSWVDQERGINTNRSPSYIEKRIESCPSLKGVCAFTLLSPLLQRSAFVCWSLIISFHLATGEGKIDGIWQERDASILYSVLP